MTQPTLVGAPERAVIPFQHSRPFQPGRSGPAPGRSAAPARDRRIDLFRGFALLAIFIDHLTKSVLSLATPHAFSFADAGEIFFFLSGTVSGLVYWPMLEKRGFAAAAMRIWRRAWTLYVAQITLLVFLIGEISLGVIKTGQFSYHTIFRSDDFLAQPDLASLHALLLGFQPAFLDILPCYILFLLAFPVVLLAMRRSVWLALVPAFGLYLLVQALGWNLTTFPRDEGWFFDPLAWQFLFVLGAVFGSGHGRRCASFFARGWIVTAAAMLAVGIAAIQLSATLHWLWPQLPALVAGALPTAKSTLAPLRLVSFFALAIVARRLLSPESRFLDTPAAEALQCCGRHSLNLFCLGVLLAVIVQIVQELLGPAPLGQLLAALAGLAILVFSAQALDWASARLSAPDFVRLGLRPAAYPLRQP